MPEPGVDGIVDAPCDTATTRKTVSCGGMDSQSRSKSIQVTSRHRYSSYAITTPGGRMVYSTCSLDPVENEAVVCEILQRCPWLELVNIDAERLFPSLICHRGRDDWPILNESSEIVDWEGEIPKLVGLSENMLNPYQRGLTAPDLSKTIRVHQHDNNTGGFYVALFEHVVERTQRVL